MSYGIAVCLKQQRLVHKGAGCHRSTAGFVFLLRSVLTMIITARFEQLPWHGVCRLLLMNACNSVACVCVLQQFAAQQVDESNCSTCKQYAAV
jgi:hypothetical protein